MVIRTFESIKVATKQRKKPKHVPQRTCVGCRQVLAKRTLIRLVRVGDEVQIDPSGKLPGRGAYLHDRKSCWALGLKGRLEKALRTTIQEQNKAHLQSFMETLSDDDTGLLSGEELNRSVSEPSE